MATRRITNTLRQQLVREDRILRAELEREVIDTAVILADELNTVVRKWKNKPTFRPEVTVKPTFLEARIRMRGPQKAKNIFRYVDEGTGKYGKKGTAYKIRAKNAPALRFRTEYHPRTKPIAQYDVGPGAASGEWRTVKEVTHPGIKGRKFASTFESILTPTFRKRVERAFRKAIRRF